MLLAIDVGNTNTVFGIYKDEELIGSFRLSTTAERTSDELGMQIHMYYSFLGLQTADTEAVIVASVVPPVMYTLINAIRKYIGVRPMIVGKDVDTGLVNRYDNPREVGIDRLVNAVSAIQKYGAPLIIIDIGTATTFDVIDETGAYCGGAIFPGIKVASEALVSGTAKLPRFAIEKPESVIGRTTLTNLQSGMYYGYVGLVKHIVQKMKQELGRQDAIVVATGGMALLISEESKVIDKLDGLLTLKGLRMIYERNKAEGRIGK